MLAKSTNGDAQYDSVYEDREFKPHLDMDMDIDTLDTTANHMNTIIEAAATTTTRTTEDPITTNVPSSPSSLPPPPPRPPASDSIDDGSYFPSATSDALVTYQNIYNNIYLGAANGKSIAEESMPCECKFEPGLDNQASACGDDDTCINRMMFMECMVDDCPCDRYCRNRRFQLRQYARVDIIRTDKKGFGLRALTDLPRNAFIMEYIGEVITNTEFLRRTRAYEMQGLQHYYFMTLKTDEIIDATKKGCMARFINHSCNPNSVTQKWVVGKTMRIGIFTKRAVKAGTELTFDYKFERYGAVAQKCYCGEPNCKGYIGGANKEEEEDEELYTPTDFQSMDEYGQAAGASSLFDKQTLLGDQEMKGAVTLTQKRMLGKMQKRRESEPLHQPDEVKKFVQRMLDSKGKPALVNRLLRTLELTNSNSSLGKDALRKFVHLHGLKMLKCWLTEWKNDEGIVEKVLSVLKHLPIANRNGLEDCHMFEVVEKYTTHENSQISDLATSILDTWKDLKSIYRIPKRAYVEPKRLEENKGNKRHDHPMDEDSSLLPALKRPPYVSSRDYMDPEDDYFEYLTCRADLNEIQWKMNFLPMPAIPTAPRAMLLESSSFAYNMIPPTGPSLSHYNMMMAAAAAAAAATVPGNGGDFDPSALGGDMGAGPAIDMQQPASVYSEDIPTGPSGSYYDLYAAATMYDPSTAAAAAATPYPPSLGSTTQWYGTPGDNMDSREQSAYHGMTNIDNTAMPVAQTPPNSNGTNTTAAPKLPPNWRQATTDDGSVYYYHKITNKTQWTFPEEKVISSVEGVDPARLEDVVNQAMSLRKSHSPSVDGSPSSGSHYHSHHPSSSTPLSRFDITTSNIVIPSTSSSTSSPSTSSHHHHPHHSHHPSQHHHSLSTSRSSGGSADVASGSGGFAIGLDEAELKQEVGKVVTRYLNGTSKQKSLWNGDKDLFKELARKLTHHIIERETQSNRKVHAMNSSLRGKIEKFIDTHGAGFVEKLKSKKDRALV